MSMILKQRVSSMERIDGPMAGLVQAQMHRKASGRGDYKVNMSKYMLLTPKVRAMIDAAVDEEARKQNCHRRELLWTLGIYSGKPAIHVTRRERIEL